MSQEPAKRELSEQDLALLGTPQQLDIYDDYPTASPADKLRVPFIEKMNGNLVVQRH